MNELQQIENLLKTGEKDNVDLAITLMEGMPEIYRELRSKWHRLSLHKINMNNARDWVDIFRGKEFSFYSHYHAELKDLFSKLFELHHLQVLRFGGTWARFANELGLNGIGCLKNIQKISFNNSNIGKLPAELGEIKRLKVLNIAYTQIGTLPETMRKTQIDELYAENTRIYHPVAFFNEWTNIGTMYYTNHQNKTAKLER